MALLCASFAAQPAPVVWSPALVETCQGSKSGYVLGLLKGIYQRFLEGFLERFLQGFHKGSIGVVL